MSNFITIPARLSYAYLFEPRRADEKQEPKYSVQLIIPKSDTKTVALIKKAIDDAKATGTKKWPNEFKNPKSPLHDADLEKPDDANLKGCYYLNASSHENQPPRLVDRQVRPITDRDMLYSGCYGNVSVNFYPYKNKSKGVGAGLLGVQFVKDGPRFDGRPEVEDMFQAIPDDDFETDF